jgi:hypothetical protein
MATVTVSSVISTASMILQDVTNVRWPQAELIGYLNDGQREVVLYKPSACVINKDVPLVAGTKQKIPADGNSLVDVVRNTDGSAIRITSRDILDSQVPDWHAVSRTASKVIHYCYSASDPKTFYVYPPSPGNCTVEAIYNASPADAVLGGLISIDDIYKSALIDYVIYRAYSKDADFAANEQSAKTHYQAFLFAINGKTASDKLSNPNYRGRGSPGVVPSSGEWVG